MTTHLWRVIEAGAKRDQGKLQRKVTAADISRATDGLLSEAVLSSWKNSPTLPKADALALLRDRLGFDYNELLEAALKDKGYLPAPPGGAMRRLELVREAARGKAEKPLKNQSRKP